MENRLTDAEWAQLLPQIRERCPRLTSADVEDCDQRMDLLSAKIRIATGVTVSLLAAWC